MARARDASAFGPHTATPWLAAVHDGGTGVYVSLVTPTGAPLVAAPQARLLEVAGAGATVRLSSGETVHIRLDEQPTYRRISPHGTVVRWPVSLPGDRLAR